MLARCDVCGVEYVEGYEGPCQEWLPSAIDRQILRGNPPMCPGTVSLVATLERRIVELERDQVGVKPTGEDIRAEAERRVDVRHRGFVLPSRDVLAEEYDREELHVESLAQQYSWNEIVPLAGSKAAAA